MQVFIMFISSYILFMETIGIFTLKECMLAIAKKLKYVKYPWFVQETFV